MPDLNARVTARYEFSGRAVGPDGYTADFVMDDSFQSWRAIAGWNLHYRHWGALAMNVRDLFTKVISRKVRIWRP